MEKSQYERDPIVDETMALASRLANNISYAERIPPEAIQREDIKKRVGKFRAYQHHLIKEREEYAASVLLRIRALSLKTPCPTSDNVQPLHQHHQPSGHRGTIPRHQPLRRAITGALRSLLSAKPPLHDPRRSG